MRLQRPGNPHGASEAVAEWEAARRGQRPAAPGCEHAEPDPELPRGRGEGGVRGSALTLVRQDAGFDRLAVDPGTLEVTLVGVSLILRHAAPFAVSQSRFLQNAIGRSSRAARPSETYDAEIDDARVVADKGFATAPPAAVSSPPGAKSTTRPPPAGAESAGGRARALITSCHPDKETRATQPVAEVRVAIRVQRAPLITCTPREKRGLSRGQAMANNAEPTVAKRHAIVTIDGHAGLVRIRPPDVSSSTRRGASSVR